MMLKDQKTRLSFGTDGWRDVIGDKFTFANIERIAQAYADYLKETITLVAKANLDHSIQTFSNSPLIIVGYDGRFLSKEFAHRITEILAGNDINFEVFDEPVPTPLISWAVREKKADGGLIITASHNPAEFNGLKIKTSWGGSAPDCITSRVESFIDYHPPIRRKISNHSHSEFSENMFKSYRRQISAYLDLDKIRAAKNRVVIDSMHGTGGRWIENFLQPGKIEAKTIRATCDPLFGKNQPEPVDCNLTALKMRVTETHALLGIATDGDADRFGAVDEYGRVLSMHDVAPLLLLFLIRQRKMTGTIVRSFSQSVLMKRIAKAYHLPLYDTPIGFKHIGDLMIKENILIGAEESGGIGLQGHMPERDGILNSLLLLEAILTLAKPLSEIIKEMHREFGSFYFKRRNLKMGISRGKDFTSELARRPPAEVVGEEVYNVETLDGTKLIFADDSWLLFRQSGTEPLLRIYSEATSIEKAQSLIEAGKLIAETQNF